MKRTIEEHAERFDEKAGEYDENDTEAYRACANLVIEHAAPGPDDVVVDLGTGTGAIALALAPDARRVIGRDISEGMLEEATRKATERGIDTVEFDTGRFRDPNLAPDLDADIVTSNFALHHLSDAEKVEAIEVIAALEPERIVLGDVMFFDEPDPDEPFYDPSVDDPSTVGHLADAFTSVGYGLTAVERVHPQVGILVAERAVGVGRRDTAADSSAGPTTDGEGAR